MKIVDEASNMPSLFPLETCPQVSDEAFNLFHAIDRELYARLIQSLSRDPAESVQVMAFWMWLERESNDLKLIKRMLSLPPPLLNNVADETASCLRFVESDEFRNGNELKLLPEILRNPVATLRFFHENRIAVLRGVSKIINTVCVRAFNDIFQAESGGGVAAAPIMYNPYFDLPIIQSGLVLPPPPPIHMLSSGFPAYDLAASMMSNEIGEMLIRNLSLNKREESVKIDKEVPQDDRTIFLTFSKGYPTTEDEVREFFTRRFGDFIEDVIMQEVGEDEQVLYARMVARTAGVIEGIVGGNKAKYSINGKHVWARKYVKKSQQQQQQKSSPSPSTSNDRS